MLYRVFFLGLFGWLMAGEWGFLPDSLPSGDFIQPAFTIAFALTFIVAIFSPYRDSVIVLDTFQLSLPSLFVPFAAPRIIRYSEIESISETSNDGYAKMILHLKRGKAKINSHFCYDRTTFTFGSPDEYYELKQALEEKMARVSTASTGLVADINSTGDLEAQGSEGDDDEPIEWLTLIKIDGIEYNMTRGEMNERFKTAEGIAKRVMPSIPKLGWIVLPRQQEKIFLRIRNLVSVLCREEGLDEKHAGAVMMILENRSKDFCRVAEGYIQRQIQRETDPGGYFERQFRDCKYYLLCWIGLGIFFVLTDQFESWTQVLAYLALALFFFI